jgi:hypothetical protein
MQGDVRYAQNYSRNDGADVTKPFLPQEGIRWLDVVGRRPLQGSGMTAAVEAAYAATVAAEAERIDDADRRARVLAERLVLEPFAEGFSNLRG